MNLVAAIAAWLKRRRLTLAALGVAMLLGGALLWWADRAVARDGAWCFAAVDDVPQRRVAVVLGTSRLGRGGRPNRFFDARIAAAIALYQAGKVEHLLVSGDNGHRGYNEPEDMRTALLAGGVPAAAIHCDYAGFRTLDSVVRAKEVFGLDGFVVVSQRFHNERAIHIARSLGLDVVGFDAEDVDGSSGVRVRLRESLARMWCVLDLTWGTGPKFLGPQVRF